MQVMKVSFMGSQGRVTVEARVGQSVMEAAVHHAVPGIIGECGGACACATCHVYLLPPWSERVGLAQGMEAEMLELTHEPRSSSRLACQVHLDETLDGLEIEIPALQGL